MNHGNSVQDADERRAVTAQDADLPALEDEDADEVTAARTSVPRNVQDIQELIDKLAAVTKQLRHPGHS
jgi:hypothetical protein